MQRFVPKGPTRSVMRYEVYRNKYSNDADFEVINAMYKRIMSEDKYLCANAQKNLSAGVFVNGEMHPHMEQGPLFFQGRVRDLMMQHHKKEVAAQREIWPARQIQAKTKPASTTEKIEVYPAVGQQILAAPIAV